MHQVILGIETSCDETSAAIVTQKEGSIQIVSNIIASSALLQAKYGGVIPDQAAREQLKSIIPVITEALDQAKLKPTDLDAIAITQGPGLIGSLLIGVETAKAFSLIWDKPLIPINHLIGHFYANWIDQTPPQFPCIGLLVSGGHTDIILFKDHGVYEYLGGTRDDAAGECFDKSARLLGLPYPGGPQIATRSKTGDPKKFPLPLPMADSGDLDFSFSGLKTAVANLVQNRQLSDREVSDIAASLQESICQILVKKTILAAKSNDIEQIIVSGGVAANQRLQEVFRQHLPSNIQLFIPPPNLCTDNAAPIAAAAFFHQPTNPLDIQANPNLSLNQWKKLPPTLLSGIILRL